MRYAASIEWAGKYFFDALNSIKAVLRNCDSKAGVFNVLGLIRAERRYSK